MYTLDPNLPENWGERQENRQPFSRILRFGCLEISLYVEGWISSESDSVSGWFRGKVAPFPYLALSKKMAATRKRKSKSPSKGIKRKGGERAKRTPPPEGRNFQWQKFKLPPHGYLVYQGALGGGGSMYLQRKCREFLTCRAALLRELFLGRKRRRGDLTKLDAAGLRKREREQTGFPKHRAALSTYVHAVVQRGQTATSHNFSLPPFSVRGAHKSTNEAAHAEGELLNHVSRMSAAAPRAKGRGGGPGSRLGTPR